MTLNCPSVPLGVIMKGVFAEGSSHGTLFFLTSLTRLVAWQVTGGSCANKGALRP